MMNRLPVQRCQYCGCEDIGLGWQHGEALVTFKKAWPAWQPATVSDLPTLRRSCVPMHGGASQVPRRKIRIQKLRRKTKIRSWR